MSTSVSVNTYTHSVTYVTDKILSSLKWIILLSGLSPEKMTVSWEILERGIKKWIETEDLEEVILEIYNSKTDHLVGRWDIEIRYGFTGDGSFWVDTDDIKYHIKKAGICSSDCEYRIMTTTKPGRPDVDGWSRTKFRSTEGFVKQSIGTTIDAGGLATGTSYWRSIT
jgi:hypothetical protein